MLNKSAATDARHSRSGKDAMLYNSAGKPFAQVESFTTKGSFNNYKYAPLGQNRELEVNGTVGVTVNISEIVVLDGELFNAVINAIANGESPCSDVYRSYRRKKWITGTCDLQRVYPFRRQRYPERSYRRCAERSFALHCNGKVENKSKLTI